MSTITRKADETVEEYHYRLYESKDELGLSNQAIADLLNKEYGTEYDESTYRKEYQALIRRWIPMIEKQRVVQTPHEFAEEMAKEQLKFNEKNRALTQMLQDQRREYRKLLNFSGRFEHIKNEIFEVVESLEYNPDFIVDANTDDNEKELVVMLNDWHYGTIVDVTNNKFNKEICKERVEYLLQETLKEINKEKYQVVNIAALGDFVSGFIHVSSRVMAEEDVVRQIFNVTELISNFVANVATVVPKVVYSQVVGNHSRSIANKNEVGTHEENFEKMILWYIKARLSNFNNITYLEDKDGLVVTEILGETIVYGHGDLDSKFVGAEKLSQFLAVIPKYIFLGHTHNAFMKTHGFTTTIVANSLIGTDDYASRGRLSGRAGQSLVKLEKTKYGVDHTIKHIHFN